MSSKQSSLPFDFEPYQNRGLFAEHFLTTRLAKQEEWTQTENLEEIRKRISDLYNKQAAKYGINWNEAQTEDKFITPVIKLLWGTDHYEVRASTIPAYGERNRPDFAFFKSTDDRSACVSLKNTAAFWKKVPVLGDAKPWPDSLDKRRGKDDYPHLQIGQYLRDSEVRWGILTNGRVWRLYEIGKSRGGNHYYQINLEELITNADPNVFKYFYFFFRREAFTPLDGGLSFVEKVFKGSDEYATNVSTNLKDSIYDALGLLMNGFYNHQSNNLNRDDTTLELVHTNSLIILYRLLFILYAEDRDLLPKDQDPYKQLSLSSIHNEIHTKLRNGKLFLPESHDIWSRLTNLFAMIDKGSQKGKIPEYNGGLFSPMHHTQIAYAAQNSEHRWEIGDDTLARVIDLLAYERLKPNQLIADDIDYSTLEVQHLGSIYEGLLELKPRFYETGVIDLITNRGERKASGSYYTPKYIVDYIVENTVGPLVEEAAKKVAALRTAVDKEIRKLETTRKEWEDPSKRGLLQIRSCNKQIEDQKLRLLEPYLTLKILDPAMGSGHFLVGAADFISMAMATDPKLLSPESIGEEEPQAYYKRTIVEHCLYGVDLNPLAVELAKLSLWLHTVSKDKALSFLDHHLRCGNSLIGARIEEDLSREPRRLNPKGKLIAEKGKMTPISFNTVLCTTHLKPILELLKRIAETPTQDVSSEKVKETLWKEIENRRPQFRAVANCWLAPFFGVPVTGDQYAQALDALGHKKKWQLLVREPWFQDAQALAHDKRFFHWELEFPEIFFDPSGLKPQEHRGFDAVVGNPPYINVEQLGREDREILMARFDNAVKRFDIFIGFIEKAYTLTRQEKRSGFIIPFPFLNQDYGEKLREALLRKSCIINLVDISKFKVFEDPSVRNIIVIFSPCDDEIRALKYEINILQVTEDPNKTNDLRGEVKEIAQEFYITMPSKMFRLELYGEQGEVISSIKQNSVSFGKISIASWGARGVPISKFHFDSQINTKCKKMLKGNDVQRFSVNWSGTWLLYDTDTLYRPSMTPFFENQKIIIQKVTGQTGLRAAFDDQGYYTDDSICSAIKATELLSYPEKVLRKHKIYLDRSFLAEAAKYDLRFLMSLLCSKLLNFYFNLVLGYDLNVYPESIEMLPIRRIAFITPEHDRDRLIEEGKEHYSGYLSSSNPNALLVFTAAQLAAIPERTDVVHDLLTFLAERMISMNKAKQEEIKGFLEWLERNSGSNIEDWSNKTQVRSYHKSDLNTLINILQKNHKKLRINTALRDFQHDLDLEFRRSMVKLTPLKAEIVATDKLIDQVVYLLYGLTEEEIGIVEGMVARRRVGGIKKERPFQRAASE